MEKIGIIGSGTWGTAIGILLSNNGHEVTLWSAIPEEIEELKQSRRHPNLPEAELPEGIRFTADLAEAMEEKDLLVMAVPSVFVRQTAKKNESSLQGRTADCKRVQGPGGGNAQYHVHDS